MSYTASKPTGQPQPPVSQQNNLLSSQNLGLETPAGVSPVTAAMVPGDAALVAIVKWVSAWTLFAIILYFVDKSEIGHAILYYALALMLFYVAVSEYKWFATVLAPVGTLGSGAQ